MNVCTLGCSILMALFITFLPAFNNPVLQWVASSSAQAQAEPKAEAYRQFSQGLEQFNHSQFQKAMQSWQRALTLYRQIQDRQNEAKALGNLGIVYRALGQYAQAIVSHQKALAIDRKIGNRRGEAADLGNLGIVYYVLGQYAQAIDYDQQSLGIAREIGDRQSEAKVLGNLGATLYASGNPSAAQQPLQQSIDLSESLRQGLNDTQQVAFFDTQLSSYLALQQVLVSLNQPTAALEVAERGRAQALLKLLCQNAAATPTDITCAHIPAITLAQMQQVAQQQQATLVEYSLIPDKNPLLFVWVIDPTGTVSFQQTTLITFDPGSMQAAAGSSDVHRGEQEIAVAEFIRGTLTSLGVGNRNTPQAQPLSAAEQTQNLRQLYQQLIQPIEALLSQDPNHPVIFIPQGALFQVPFAALQDDQGTDLIDQHTILTAPSIQVLSQIGQQPPAAFDDIHALVVGNPATAPVQIQPGIAAQRLPNLPGAAREARQIADLFHTQALIGAEARKATVLQRMQQARVIHLATHGLLDYTTSGTPGAIALAPDLSPANDGLLSSDEILKLKLNAELVVLSACDTGGGRITGDGVIGLSRALISAGTPNVLVSLWKVPDVATAELMESFYHQWRDHPEAGKASALRAAMIQVKSHYPDAPLSWAGFTLIGAAQLALFIRSG